MYNFVASYCSSCKYSKYIYIYIDRCMCVCVCVCNVDGDRIINKEAVFKEDTVLFEKSQIHPHYSSD